VFGRATTILNLVYAKKYVFGKKIIFFVLLACSSHQKQGVFVLCFVDMSCEINEKDVTGGTLSTGFFPRGQDIG
jgi:hypothetical protein